MRATKGTKCCLENASPFWGLLYSFEPNTLSLSYRSLSHRQAPDFGRPCIRAFPRTQGCFIEIAWWNCLMKITKKTFLWLVLWLTMSLWSLQKKRIEWTTPYIFKQLYSLQFSVHSFFFFFFIVFLFFSSIRSAPFINTTAEWEGFCTINSRMFSPEVLLVRGVAERLE